MPDKFKEPTTSIVKEGEDKTSTSGSININENMTSKTPPITKGKVEGPWEPTSSIECGK